jgi:ribosome-binding protein aMBF1 (putative translation factor)
MQKSTGVDEVHESNPLSVSEDELLDADKAHLVRAAIAQKGLSQREFCTLNNLNASLLSQVLNRYRTPPSTYVDVLEDLLVEYIRSIRLMVKEVDNLEQ